MVEANPGSANTVKGSVIPPSLNKEEEITLLNEFMDDVAFDALVDSVGEAFGEDMDSNAGSSALLD